VKPLLNRGFTRHTTRNFGLADRRSAGMSTNTRSRFLRRICRLSGQPWTGLTTTPSWTFWQPRANGSCRACRAGSTASEPATNSGIGC